MKKTFILLLIFSFCFSINAQDTITLKKGKVINAFIIEKSDTKIKYRTDSVNNEDSTFSIKLSRINTINYVNGEVDLLCSQNPRSKFPLGVSIGINIFNNFSFIASIDYLITPNLNAEIKYSFSTLIPYFFPTLSFGGKYWFAKKYSNSGFSPYLGLFLTRFRQENDEFMWNNEPPWKIVYLPEIPIGINYISKFGLQTSFQMSLPYLSPEFKIGWRF